MGQIVSSYDILPEGTDVDLNTVIEAIPKVIPEGVKLLETKIQPVAFGLMKVNAGFLIDDTSETIGSDLEKALSSIPGINNVECVSSTNY
ncbi:translation elongation factor EF-1beta [Methanomassiliicoccaceae archaeon COG_1]|nr:translation elongation factor EF-1beta [Methanomassiliicoccaceae archaeon COG_1]